MKLKVRNVYHSMLLEIANSYEEHIEWWRREDVKEDVRAALRNDYYWHDMGDKKLEEYIRTGWWAFRWDWKEMETAPYYVGAHDLDVYEWLEMQYRQDVYDWLASNVEDLDEGGNDIMCCGVSTADQHRELWKVVDTHEWWHRPDRGPRLEWLRRQLHDPDPRFPAG